MGLRAARLAVALTVLCFLLQVESSQTRCMEGRWWGPNSIGEDSLIVAARYEEDVSWMATHLQGIMPFVVYNTKDSSATHYTSVHNGNEAAAYLQFIVDYYDCLPAYIAFIHAHRRDMKVAPDFDMDKDLQLVNWRQPQQQQQQTDYHKQAARAVTVAWDQLFGAELGPLPDELYVNGGGQFLVRRERVLAHSRQFYQDCLTWLDESLDLSPWDKGMVFEYTWKSIFGEAAAVLDLNIWS
ncbi:hypothetical protein WJX79_008775 [Trebouxia sp. C0005]